MKVIIIFFISVIIFPQSHANDKIPTQVTISDYSKNGQKYGCALVRNKEKFELALNIYGWNEKTDIPKLDWDTEVAVISTGYDIQYLDSKLDKKNKTIIVKWKKKPSKGSGKIVLPGGAVMWGGSTEKEQTMVVVFSRTISSDNKVLCKREE